MSKSWSFPLTAASPRLGAEDAPPEDAGGGLRAAPAPRRRLGLGRIANWALRPTGFRLTRVDAPCDVGALYVASALSAAAVAGRLRVAIVGANDGRFNDPFHALMQAHPTIRDRSTVLLIEPQEALAGPLAETYRDHPDHYIATAAIGRPGTLRLYAVDERFWPALQPRYAAGWPVYRAPTGVTSSDRAAVARWILAQGGGRIDPDEAIAVIEPPCRRLLEIMRSSGLPPTLDLLQIDAEGADDEVIYNADLDTLAPAIIQFEAKRLGPAALRRVKTYLEGLGYLVFAGAHDNLAVRAD